MERLFYNWSEVSSDIKSIISQISYSDWFPDFVVGIKRGGLIPATVLSHYLDVPMLVVSCQLRDGKDQVDLLELDQNIENKRLLIVDDICDEGETFQKVSRSLKEKNILNFKTCSIFFNVRQNFYVDFKAKKIDRDKDRYWIVFPWEI